MQTMMVNKTLFLHTADNERIGIELNTGNGTFIYQPSPVISAADNNTSLVNYATAVDINRDNRKEILVLGEHGITVFSTSC